MNFYKLCNEKEKNWFEIRKIIGEFRIVKIQDLVNLFSNFIHIDEHINQQIERTLDYLINFNTEKELIEILNDVIEFSLKLPEFFSDGKLRRLSRTNRIVELNRCEILCIICHMFLCTLKKDEQTARWATFEIWLIESTDCTRSYIQSLIEYFKDSFKLIKIKSDFLKQVVKFEKKILDRNHFEKLLQNPTRLANFNLKIDGSIGDNSYCEVDFANKNIGYGKTGTQEEILFASSPELCTAVLFCDPICDDEAIIIQGARKFVAFQGFGMNVNFRHSLPLDYKDWNKRIIIAIDALDFSCVEKDIFKKQMEEESLTRELTKAYVGFSTVKNSWIETGHWGCGYFKGNRLLKAIIQLIACSLSENNLNFYSNQNEEFIKGFIPFIGELKSRNITTDKLWNCIIANNYDENNLLKNILKNLNQN